MWNPLNSILVFNHDKCHQQCNQIQCYTVIYHFQLVLCISIMLLLSIPFDFSNDAPRIKVLRIKKARWCLENTSALLLADGLSLHYQSLLFTEKSRTCVFFLSFAKWKLYYSYQPLFHLGNNWVQLPYCEVLPARYLLIYWKYFITYAKKALF